MKKDKDFWLYYAIGVVIVVLGVAVSSSYGEVRGWSTVDGLHLDAKLVRKDATGVVLHAEQSKERLRHIPYTKLSRPDLIWLLEMSGRDAAYYEKERLRQIRMYRSRKARASSRNALNRKYEHEHNERMQFQRNLQQYRQR